MTSREICKACKKDYDLNREMAICLGCEKLICVDCCVSEEDIVTFIQKTEKGTIISEGKDPGPCNWVCVTCFTRELGRVPKRFQWTEDSLSSGDQPDTIPEDPKPTS